MKNMILNAAAGCLLIALAGALGAAQTPQPVRPLGVVTEIHPGHFLLRTDAGTDLTVQLSEAVTTVRVPPGAKDLKAATTITLGDISVGDRVLVRGRVSDDQKSVLATSVIVMTQTDIAKAHEAERLDWQRRGVGGVVKAVNPQTKELTLAVPNSSPTPANPTHAVALALAPKAVLLRYAPDSVKFRDAKPGAFEEIKVGDQVRALGNVSQDGNRFAAEKLVSGTFRNLGVTVTAVDAPNGTLTVKDLASGKPVLVRTNADSSLHQLPPFLAQMIAAFNSGVSASGETPRRAEGGGFRGAPGGGTRDFQQMLERTPAFALSDLKAGDPLIVVSTEGAKPLEVTAIVMLTGVEPILQARPKGSSEVVLGPWNMSMSGGEGGP